MIKLKPCPFCGGEANTKGSCDRVSVIGCDACGFHIHGDGILSTKPNDKPIHYSDGKGGILPASDVKIQEYYHAENMQKLAGKWNTRHVPEGYVLVPVEHTAEMMDAFLDIYDRRGWFSRAYKAMIQAAQENT